MKLKRAMNLPPAFALPRARHVAQQIVVREAVSAVTGHSGGPEHLDILCAELAVAIELRKLALAQIKTHLVPREQLEALAEPLADAAEAVASVKARHAETGRVGCNYEQRNGLLGLADIVDQMRDVLPRSLWLAAIRSVFEKTK